MTNSLKISFNIDETRLDNNYYFESLVEYAKEDLLIDELGYNMIKLQQLNLINVYVKKMTGGSTTSIDKKVASELLQSINYNISYYLKRLNNPDDALNEIINRNLIDLVNEGNKLIEKDLFKYKMYSNYVISNMLNINNDLYQETFKIGIKEALKKYNKDYEAYDKVITGDYITAIYPSSLGLDFLYEYMNNFNNENLFLKEFNVYDINNLLKNRTKDYKYVVINPFEEVLKMIVCLSINNQDIFDLYIDNVNIELLYLKLISKSDDEIKDLIYNHTLRILKKLNVSENIKDYIIKVIPKIEIEIINSLRSDTLDKLLGINEIN